MSITEKSPGGALVLEGGSLRCLFSAGIVDVLLEHDIHLPLVLGVSAGALTGANYLSKQIGRTADVNLQFVNDRRYLGLSTLLRHHMVFNFDFLFGEISRNLLPFDFQEFLTTTQRFICVATNCETGEPEYFEKGRCRDIFEAMKASCSIPLLSKMITLDGKKYLDGACSLAIPYQKALDEGCEKILVITTRHKGYRKMPISRVAGHAYMAGYRNYPKLVSSLLSAPRSYARELRRLDALEDAGRMLVLRPETPITISRTERDVGKLKALYEEGRRQGEKNLERIKAYLYDSQIS